MITFEQFVSELKSSLPTYAEEMDIPAVKLHVIDRLKKLGNNVTVLRETMVNVRNSKAELPEDFKSLKLAFKTEPFGCDVNGDIKNITDSYVYRERIENGAYFDDVNQEYVTDCDPTIITEKITINNTDLTFYYKWQWLSLVPHIDKSSLSADCLNMHPTIRNSYPNEISISGRMVNTNFSKGGIYVQYYGLPTSEDGEICIPSLTTDDIYNYIMTYVKVQLAEYFIANDLNPKGISQLYPAWAQQLPLLHRSALVEAKFHGLGKRWAKNIKILNKRDTAVFNLPILNYR